MAVQLFLLGGFRATDASGGPVALPTRKAEAMTAYLALNGPTSHYRDKLAGLLWGSSPDAHARASLRQTLLRVRRAWPGDEPPFVVTEGPKIGIDPAAAVVDVAAFERSATEATPQALQAAASRYQGDLLDGISIDEEEFEDWLCQERARLRELALGVLHRLLEHYAKTGAIERGVDIANRLLALDPFQEGAQRMLMRLYLYQERRAAALAQYQHFCRALQDEMEAKPAPETVALYQQIIDGPALSPPEHEATASQLPLLPPPMANTAGRQDHPRWQNPLAEGPSIAVLPFEGLDADSAEGYFGDGVAEDVITELTRFRELHVIARNSAFSYRGNRLPLRRIGRDLGVQYLLKGGLRRQDSKLRITAQLIDAESSQQIWAERYDQTVGDLFAIQDEIVRQIVTTLVDRIAAERLLRARRKPPEVWQAYDHWLQGMAHLRQVDMRSLALARRAFEAAIATDPGYARAYAGLAMTYFQAWSCYNWNAWAMLGDRAFRYARQAVDLDENDHHAHGILSGSFVFKGAYEPARHHIERALALNPNDAVTLANASVVWNYYGDAGEAVKSAETAMQLDPHHPDWYAGLLGMARFSDHRYETAVAAMAHVPDAICDTRAYLAAAHAWNGEAGEAARHGAEFLRSCSDRMGGNVDTEATRYFAWLRRANPYRRDKDTAHLIEGLRRAGLPV